MPQFPQKFSDENKNAIAYSNQGIAAVGCGSSIYLTYIKDHFHLQSISPITFSMSTIINIEFHPEKSVIIASDSTGTVYFYDFFTRILLTTFKRVKQIESIMDIKSVKSSVFILYNKHLVALSFPSEEEKCRLLWEINLPMNYSKIALDSFSDDFVLYSENENFFTIFSYKNANEKPVPYHEKIEFSSTSSICCIQWSLHLKEFIFIITLNDIFLYHTKSQMVFPITSLRVTTSTYNQLIQIYDDFSRFLIITTNGSICIYKFDEMIKDSINFRLVFEHLSSTQNGSIINGITSPLLNNLVLMFHSAFGIGLFDLKTNNLLSYNLYFPNSTSSFDSDGTNYVIGTNDGYIISGSLFEFHQQKRFFVTNEPISFVSLDSSISKIYWQSGTFVGVVDIPLSNVEMYKSKISVIMKCYGSRHGGLIIQHDPRALGIFINGKEHPLLLNTDLIDLSIDDIESTSSHGSFSLLLKSNEICFYKYSTKEGIREFKPRLKQKGINLEPICYTAFCDSMVIGYSTGILTFFENNKTFRVSTGFPYLRCLKYSPQGLLGMGKTNTLFKVTDEGVSVCPFPIKQYCSVDDTTVLVMCIDDSVRFVKIKDWTFISQITNYSPTPSDDIKISDFINNPKILCNSLQASIVWECIKNNKYNLKIQSKFGSGNSGNLETIQQILLSSIQIQNHDLTYLKLRNLLFSEHFSEAGELLSEYDDIDYSILAALIFELEPTNESNPINEKIVARLKSSAISLFENGNFQQGSLLLRLGRLDKIAVNYLIDYGEIELALDFIRNCLNQEDKKRSLFTIGCKFYESKNHLLALGFFSSSQEYHVVLSILESDGCIIDCFFLMKYFQDQHLLKETPEPLQRLLPGPIAPLDTLCNTITNKFTNLVQNLHIDINDIKLKTP